MTNADYIVNMSDEELAQFLCKHFNCPPEGNCPVEDDCDGTYCIRHIRKWLQEERKADNDCK